LLIYAGLKINRELNLIPPIAFVKKEPRMLDDYRILRWWQGK
jgi:hypothetical protein